MAHVYQINVGNNQCCFAAEKCLESLEKHPGFTTLLLDLVNNGAVDMVIRIAAVVTFKNVVKRNWRIVSAVLYFKPLRS